MPDKSEQLKLRYMVMRRLREEHRIRVLGGAIDGVDNAEARFGVVEEAHQ